MSLNKQLSLLGLAMKAGKVVSGEFAVEKYVKEGKAHLVLVAEDASKNTKKSAHDMCVFYKVPLYDIGTKEKNWKSERIVQSTVKRNFMVFCLHMMKIP